MKTQKTLCVFVGAVLAILLASCTGTDDNDAMPKETEVNSDADTPPKTAINEVLSGECGENLFFVLDSNGTLTIKGTGDMHSWSLDVPAPWYDLREEISSVIIGETVTSVGDRAFGDCIYLTGAYIPTNVAKIGYDAFFACGELTIYAPTGSFAEEYAVEYGISFEAIQ